MKHSIIIILFICSLTRGWSQKMEEITHREVNVHFNDSSIKANVLLADKRVQLNSTTNYYWYYNNSIKINQGDYKGKLLDGEYQVTTGKGNLITKGKFVKGTKNGIWKTWNDQGELLSIYRWLRGNKSGEYKKYENGILVERGNYLTNRLNGPYIKYKNKKVIEKGKYKNGLLQGKIITYDNDTITSKTNYKKGKIVEPKEKKVKKEDSPEFNKGNKKIIEKEGNSDKKSSHFWKKEFSDEATDSKNKEIDKKKKEPKVKKEKKVKTKKEKDD